MNLYLNYDISKLFPIRSPRWLNKTKQSKMKTLFYILVTIYLQFANFCRAEAVVSNFCVEKPFCAYCQCPIYFKLKMIRDEGYPAEKHEVVTEDGYILSLHRIPNRTRGNKVMLLMHGLLSSSACYVLYGKNISAAYKYSNAEYDVWMGNYRGNTNSRHHTRLDPEKTAFWNFSWHEMGVYDLPAMIDYILAATNHAQLIYVGHSQGVTGIFVTLVERPEYNKKISILHAMTPPIIFKYVHPLFPKKPLSINQYGVRIIILFF